MTVDRDLERLLDSWLADGPLVVADRVIDDTAARIAHQRQRPAWRLLSWRDFHVISTSRTAAALAAVVVIAVIGLALVLRPAESKVGRPSAPASPTPTESPAASATARPSQSPVPYPSSGILAPGTHASTSFQPRVSFTLTAPWVLNDDEISSLELFPESAANRAEWARTGNPSSSVGIASDLASPYFACESWENNRGATAAAMVAAVTGTKALATTGVVDVAVGGLTGKQFDVRLNPDWTETCPGDPPGLDLADQRGRVLLLDRPGHKVLVIFVGSSHAADHVAFLAQAMPLVQSFEFSP